jgi:hypothetical protein
MHPEYRFLRLRLWAALTVVSSAFAAAAFLGAPTPASADAESAPQVLVVLLPNGTSVADLGRVPELAPGLISAGIGSVPPEQTYLDLGQGNRVSETLYDHPLPAALPRDGRIAHWRQIVARADSAPADIVPGLLAAALKQGGRTISADPRLGLPQLLAADRHGLILRAHTTARPRRCFTTVCVLAAGPAGLASLVRTLRGDDLLIALERPPPEPDHPLAIGIAGRGFGGNLTSDSTRLRGYVLSTDVGPTILQRLGISVPSQMNGEEIRSEGDRDVGAVVSLQDRLASIIDRRGPVIGVSALVWIALAALAVALSRGALTRPAVRMSALSGILLPSMLLIGAAVQPSLGVERLIVLLGAPLLAALALRLLPGYRALLFACGLTVLAFSADVIAGSPLTPLSLIGPDPGLGVRFYGIGNELEAALTPLILFGIGVAVTVLAPKLAPRRVAAVFAVTALPFAFVFASGRFGADVGAAITLPAGAAGAVAALRVTRRSLLLIVAAPVAALAGLAVLDLLLGGDAHLTRSVLDAGGLHDLGNVAERRLRLSAHSFSQKADSLLFWLTLAVIALAVYRRDRILGWFEATPALRAGFLGACLAVLVATLANDSGALLLEVGTLYLALLAGFAWTQPRSAGPGHDAGGLPEPTHGRA